MPALGEIVRRVNEEVRDRPFGQLQPLRKQLRELSRVPTRAPFGRLRGTDWTFHSGGRDELQFNLGFDELIDGHDFRFGVAFSFEPSQSLPDYKSLEPKVRRFNDYMVEHAATFDDLRMWHYPGGPGNTLRRPGPIEDRLFNRSVFVFMGGTAPSDGIDYRAVADTLDRLLPLWRFIEESEHTQREELPFVLQTRSPSRLPSTEQERSGGRYSVALRHNAIATRLYVELASEYGEQHVGAEQSVPGAGRADMVVDAPDRRIVYEIKTAGTARQCVREAVGQLLDYGCGPGGLNAGELCVVGTPILDAETEGYMGLLNQRFPALLTYRRVDPDG